jgi:hypothetical protein
MLGTKAIQMKDNEIEQPIFSLTQGSNDMISNFDLPLTYHNKGHGVEFKLIEGNGPGINIYLY